MIYWIVPHLIIGFCITIYGVVNDKYFMKEEEAHLLIAFIPFSSIAFSFLWPLVLYEKLMGTDFIDKEKRRWG